MRILLALGGNAMTAPDGRARPDDQIRAARRAMAAVADLVADDIEVVLTHGNGPQVGNLLVKNELAAGVVPPVPLDWCVAQTQGTLGLVLMNALEEELAARSVDRRTATVVSRARVATDDPAFAAPTKPIGRFLPAEEAAVLVDLGETWEDRGDKGWRRVVPSPEPIELLDAAAVTALLDAGFVAIGNGGGGVPVVREDDGRLRGVQAVIDKDLGAALLARAVSAEVLVVVTDVSHVMLGFGTPQARPLERVTVSRLRTLAGEGHFADGSMAPKVEAACRFVEAGGRYAAITHLDGIRDAVEARGGTTVVPDTAQQAEPTIDDHETR